MDLLASGLSYSVIGAARSGLAAANFLARIGRDVLLSDTRAEAELATGLKGLDPRVATTFGANHVRAGDVVVISPGVSPLSDTFRECQAQGAIVVSEVELFGAWHQGPIVAITGTDGKSTTTKLTGDLLAAGSLDPFVGGNIGNALTEALPDLAPDRWVVAEVSNAQLITTHAFHPHVAAILNIAEDHTSYHGSFQAYQQAKRRVWQAMEPGDTLILNAGDPVIPTWDIDARADLAWFHPGGGPGAARFAEGAIWLGDERLLAWDEFPIPGLHNVENVLAAALTARAAGVDAATIRATLRTFRGLPHRMEAVGQVEGVRWFNDSKATNPHAAMAGLKGLDRPFVVLLGGYDKGFDVGDLTDLVATRAHGAVCYGAMGGRLAAALQGRLPLAHVETLDQAVRAARGLAAPDGYVVLCPATSSFDQFRDFEARGDAFRDIVSSLGRGKE